MDFAYLKGITFKYTFKDFGPEVYFATMIGINIFTPCIAVDTTIISSFDMPVSISFNVITLSTANPILIDHFINILHLLINYLNTCIVPLT